MKWDTKPNWFTVAYYRLIHENLKYCCGSLSNKQTCAAGGARTRGPWITRRRSWPLLQRGVLFLVDPGVIEALHSSSYIATPKSSRLEDFVKRGVGLEWLAAGTAEPMIEALLCMGMLCVQITSGSPMLRIVVQQTCAVGRARTRDPWITRKAS